MHPRREDPPPNSIAHAPMHGEVATPHDKRQLLHPAPSYYPLSNGWKANPAAAPFALVIPLSQRKPQCCVGFIRGGAGAKHLTCLPPRGLLRLFSSARRCGGNEAQTCALVPSASFVPTISIEISWRRTNNTQNNSRCITTINERHVDM